MDNPALELKQADIDAFVDGLRSIVDAFAEAFKAFMQAVVKVIRKINTLFRRKKKLLYKAFLKAYPEYFEKLEGETHAGS